PREFCVCGLPLPTTAQAYSRAYAWGAVYFKRCPSCRSWCQSPQIISDSLAAWYDSDIYQGSTTHSGAFYSNYLADEPNRLREARVRFSRDLAAILPPSGAEVLEIGCASGSLLVALRDAG